MKTLDITCGKGFWDNSYVGGFFTSTRSNASSKMIEPGAMDMYKEEDILFNKDLALLLKLIYLGFFNFPLITGSYLVIVGKVIDPETKSGNFKLMPLAAGIKGLDETTNYRLSQLLDIDIERYLTDEVYKTKLTIKLALEVNQSNCKLFTAAYLEDTFVAILEALE